MGLEEANKKIVDLITLSNDEDFLFQLGNVVEYTREEYKKAVIDFYVRVYGVTSRDEDNEDMKNLKYKSSLLLILASDGDILQKRFQIQQIINTMCINGREKLKFKEAIRQIECESIFGEELRELLHRDVLDESLSDANKVLERVKNKKQF